MAGTRDGRVLTDQHRRLQVRLAVKSDSQIRRAMMLLDPSDIDGTRALWLQRMTQIVQKNHGLSERAAVDYLAKYRLAEIGTVDGVIVRPGLDVAATQGVLDAAGPQGFKKRIREGTPQLVAFKKASDEIAAEARKAIMSGGRGAIRATGAQDVRAIGWRRVTGPDPCTFCAMLASRGPAYTSEAKALADGNGDPYHGNCHCTVEIGYSDWVPTRQEEQFIDAYHEAAEAAEEDGQTRTAQSVLWRMREKGSFRDSQRRRRMSNDIDI